jgi:hypothetical protein
MGIFGLNSFFREHRDDSHDIYVVRVVLCCRAARLLLVMHSHSRTIIPVDSPEAGQFRTGEHLAKRLE